MTACVCCLGTEPKRALVARERMFGMDGEFEYLECGECGTVFLPSPPADLARYYPAHYYSYQPQRTAGGFAVLKQKLELLRDRHVMLGKGGIAGRWAARLRPADTCFAVFPLPGRDRLRVLDVGCGAGSWLRHLARVGFRHLHGCDPFNAGSIDEDGVIIFNRDIAGIEGEYEFITFHHCLEHIPDPEAALHAARRLLSPDGRILVRVPVAASDAFSRYREHWVQLDAPRHLTLFSVDGFNRLAARASLTVIQTGWDSTGFQFWGSEAYLEGHTFQAATANRDRLFSREQLAAWEREARDLNRTRRGDQACFFLGRADRAVAG